MSIGSLFVESGSVATATAVGAGQVGRDGNAELVAQPGHVAVDLDVEHGQEDQGEQEVDDEIEPCHVELEAKKRAFFMTSRQI